MRILLVAFLLLFSHAAQACTALSGLLTNGGSPVTLTYGGCYTVASDTTLQNQTLNVNGATISGNGRLIMSGTASLYGPGTITNGYYTNGTVYITDAGTYVINGVVFSGLTSTAAIYVYPPNATTIALLDIESNSFETVNYGILRNGGASLGAVAQTTILNNLFEDVEGDAIELNVIPYDTYVLISGNDIEDVNNTHDTTFWGMAIGVAGNYTSNFADGSAAQSIAIVYNTIGSARAGIHCEACKRLTIIGNAISDISASYSNGSGIDEAGIEVYGSTQFVISANSVAVSDADEKVILVSAGVLSGNWIGYPINFSLDGNILTNSNGTANIWGTQWGTSGYAGITNNSADNLTYSGGSGMNITLDQNTW